ncbi:MAG TPA: methyltransferase [Streptosporangiaceae bacterium]|nr:methyltransferase [Streptosporangiaceae bacterium]
MTREDNEIMSELNSLRIRQLFYTSWLAQSVYAAACLGLADLVATGTSSVEELAARTHTRPDYLYRLMRALAGAGVFTETSAGTFGMTPQAHCLVSGGEDSVKELVLFYGNEVHKSYGHLAETLRTGIPAVDAIYGMSLWERMESVPETGTAFRRGMGAPSWREQLPLPENYDFSGIRRLVDVGGGEGTMLAAVLHEHPGMQGVLVDISAGVDRTMHHFIEAGVADRTRLVESSAFDELPRADGYMMSCVLHVMDDAASLVALNRVRDAIEADGRLVILERIVSPPDEPSLAKILDLSMMLTNGGRERTETEWHDLLAQAGFKLTRIVALPYFSGGAELTAIEAAPVPR